MVTLENVSAGYGTTIIVKNVNCRMEQGLLTGIVGPNGSGKTTLLRVLAKVLPVLSGKISISGKILSEISAVEFARKIAFLPSRTDINYPYSVREFLEMARYPFLNVMRDIGARDREIIGSVAEEFKITRLLQQKVPELSEGEKQRVCLAQCFVQKPSLLLLDEPTSHLDIGHQFLFMDLIKKAQKEEKITVISVLHDLNLASQYCEKILMMDKGTVFSYGSPEEVLTYRNIEPVYQTHVLVYPHPVFGKPYVFGVPEGWEKP